jgi:hypothetical protein
MTMRSAHWIASAFLLATGCIGGYQPGNPNPNPNPNTPDPANPGPGTNNNPPPSATARQLFDANVAPMLAAVCASCHAGAPPTTGPTFLGSGATMYYSMLTGDARFVNAVPAKSELVTKGLHEGPALTTAAATNIDAWLNQELVERGATLPQPPPPTDLVQKQLAAFGNCMQLTDYTAAGMNDLQNQDTTGSAGNCYSCHSTGMFVYLSKDPTQNFDRLHNIPWLLKLAIAQVNPDGTFKDIIPANRFRDRGTETGHPGYILTNARQTALDTFFQQTYTHYKAGNCAPPPPSPPGGGAGG